MNTTDGHSQLLDALEASLCQDADIEFAVIFGSQTDSDTHASSDLDVAVKFSEELSPHERFQKRCFLSGDLQFEGAPFVDVSDIESLPIEVAHDAVTGELLCGDEQAFDQFKTEVETAFEKQRDDFRRHHRDVIDRVAEDGLRG